MARLAIFAILIAGRLPLIYHPHWTLCRSRRNLIDPLAFYSVLFHESGHATGAEHRLNRDLKKRFSTHAAAVEEIVAELTAAFILADLGLSFRPRDDHAAYVADWLTALKNDTRAIVTAASQAQAAADWMHARQPHQEARPGPSEMEAA